MNFSSIARQSIIALKANKLRSAFSILGIVIGVGAVVVILSFGQGLKTFVTGQIEAYGPNILGIAVKTPGAGQVGTVVSMVQGVKITTLKTSDIKDLKDKDRFPYVEAVSGQAISQEWVTYRDKEKKPLIYGCSPDYPLIMKMTKIDRGRFFNDRDNQGLAKVAVLGSNLVEEFFGKDDPLGKRIKIKGQSYEVIGILKEQGGISFGGITMDDFLYIPVETVLKELLGIDYLSEAHLLIADQKYFSQAEEEISRLLRHNHNIQDPSKDDFQINTMTEILSQVNQISVILNLLLGFLAAISLLVGGIGIMNIMLVSVSERTREIGLRKALGATSKNVLMQFLIESVMITGMGGIIGIIGGVFISLIGGLGARSQGLAWPLVISWLAVVAAFIVATAIGVVFGIYPARKAAQLDPIKALKKAK